MVIYRKKQRVDVVRLQTSMVLRIARERGWAAAEGDVNIGAGVTDVIASITQAP